MLNKGRLTKLFSRNKFKYVTYALITICLSLALILTGCDNTASTGGEKGSQVPGEIEQEIEFLRIVGGGAGGTWNAIAGKLADILAKEFPEITVSSQPGTGSKNPISIEEREAEIALSYTYLEYDAYNGEGTFDKPYHKINHLMSLMDYVSLWAVPASSDITSFDDIKSEPIRISVGAPGSAQMPIIEETLKAYGITLDDIKDNGGTVNYVPYEAAVEMMQDGALDVIFITGTIPDSKAMQLAENPGIRFIQQSEDVLQSVLKNLHGLTRVEMPAGVYKGQIEAIPAVSYQSCLMVYSELSEDFVYSLTEAIGKNYEDLCSVFSGAKDMVIENSLSGVDIPIHPGAKRYYDEHNITKK